MAKPKHPDGEWIARQAFAAGLRKTVAPAHRANGAPDLTGEQLMPMVAAVLDDLEARVVATGVTGTEVVAVLFGALLQLMLDSDHPPAERVEIWRALAGYVETLLTEALAEGVE